MWQTSQKDTDSSVAAIRYLRELEIAAKDSFDEDIRARHEVKDGLDYLAQHYPCQAIRVYRQGFNTGDSLMMIESVKRIWTQTGLHRFT